MDPSHGPQSRLLSSVELTLPDSLESPKISESCPSTTTTVPFTVIDPVTDSTDDAYKTETSTFKPTKRNNTKNASTGTKGLHTLSQLIFSSEVAESSTTGERERPILSSAALVVQGDREQMETTGGLYALPGVTVATEQLHVPAAAVKVAARGCYNGIWCCCQCRKWTSSSGPKCVRAIATGVKSPEFKPCGHSKCSLCDDLTDAGRKEILRSGRPRETEALFSVVREAQVGTNDKSVWF